MGQVLSFPPKHQHHSHERVDAALKTLCMITYMLGFFIAGPMLVMCGFAFAFGAQPVAALICVGLLLVDWPITKAAYKRL